MRAGRGMTMAVVKINATRVEGWRSKTRRNQKCGGGGGDRRKSVINNIRTRGRPKASVIFRRVSQKRYEFFAI